MIMPTKPNKPPKSRMEKSTQIPDNPVLLPRIFGPMILPSTCCKITIKITNIRQDIGLTVSKMIADGIAPMYGPKNGMIFVKPTMTLMRIAKAAP